MKLPLSRKYLLHEKKISHNVNNCGCQIVIIRYYCDIRNPSVGSLIKIQMHKGLIIGKE